MLIHYHLYGIGWVYPIVRIPPINTVRFGKFEVEVKAMKYVISAALTILISGCSGGSSDQYGPECGANSSCALPELLPAESIVGLWESSRETDGTSATSYTEITADGGFKVYNYQQTSNNSGENCHVLNENRIWRYTDSSRYEILSVNSEQSVSAVIYRQNESLFVTMDSEPEENWLSIVEFVTEDLLLCQ